MDSRVHYHIEEEIGSRVVKRAHSGRPRSRNSSRNSDAVLQRAAYRLGRIVGFYGGRPMRRS